jgi:hypothetical protein
MRTLIAACLLLLSACASSVVPIERVSLVQNRPVVVEVRGADDAAVKALRETLLDALPLPGGGMGDGSGAPSCGDASACHRLRVEITHSEEPNLFATYMLGPLAGAGEVRADVFLDGVKAFSVSGSSAYGNAFVSKVEFAAKEAGKRLVEALRVGG